MNLERPGNLPVVHDIDSVLDLESIYIDIRTHENAISAIDEEIDGLMRTIRQLQFRRREHAEVIRRCKGIITLARRLPYEILAKIFEMCVRDGYTKTPLLVSHVCSHWRKAANIPSTWSHVYVDFESRDPFGRTKFWLARAKSSELRVTLEIRQDRSRLPEVMGLLLKKRSQWRALTINSLHLANANSALTACTGPFPQLRALSISVLQEFSDVDDQIGEETRELASLRFLFRDAPILTTTQITKNNILTPQLLPLSITNLALLLPSYRFTFNLSLGSVLRLLEELPSLEVFSMILPAGHVRGFTPVGNSEDRVTLHHLREISLTGWRAMYHLLPHLLTPSLAVLRLRSPDDLGSAPDADTGRCLLEFLVQASPPLEELELRDADIPSSCFIQCFSRLNGLKTLRLHESEISDQVLAELHRPSGLCPRLSNLDFRWCGFFKGRALVDLVRSRQDPNRDTPCHSISTLPTPISKVTVIHCSFVQARDIADLALLTLCQVVITDSGDYCRSVGCCVNDRYRRRLALEGIGRAGRLIL